MSIQRVVSVCIAVWCVGAQAVFAGDNPPHGLSPHEAGLLGQEAASFDVAVPAALEVKKAKTGHLLVRPKVNGREPGWFIFDTGAGICVVTPQIVQDLGLVQAGEVDAVGVGGSKKAQMYRADEVRLGPVTLKRHPFMATDLSFLDEHLGERIVGVIGYGVLSQCVAEIDFERPAIALHDPAKYALPPGAWTNVDLKDRVPVITATYEGHEGLFMLDTGDHCSVNFYAPAVKKNELLKGREVSDVKIGGVGGFVAGKHGVLASLTIGEEKMENLPVEFAIEAKGTQADATRDGKIGTGVLGQFLVVTDYANERLAFLKKAE